MSTARKKYTPYFLLFIIVLVSRLPFLSAGYGVEEDSWGIALAGLHTHMSGIYEPSRFPGHPVHEYIYSAWRGHSAFFYNFFSAFFSAVAALVFAMILKHLNFRYAFLGALALAFTPVVYISSTYTIDFTWSLALMLTSFYFILKDRFILCGIFLGLAIGCRITMGAMLLPFILVMWDKRDVKNILKVIVPMSVTVFLVFLPLITTFGSAFFMYYDQFPYPPLTKVLYKMSIGVFGLTGTIILLLSLFIYLFRKRWLAGKLFKESLRKGVLGASMLVIILFIISYFRLPQKSGYMITIIPFVIILAGYFLNGKWFITLCLSLILSSFIFSVNLTDKLRGAEYSRFALKFKVSGQEIFFDPLSGPIFSDYSKRKQKMRYTCSVMEGAKQVNKKTVVIAGWWYNELNVRMHEAGLEFPDVLFVSYIDLAAMERYIAEGYEIKYLPEQGLYNDLMFGMNATEKLAEEYTAVRDCK